MFAVIEFSRNTQRAVCMLMSAAIVSLSLTLGAYAAQSELHDTSYTVTVHQ
jgi:hypothetical protein